MPEATCPKTNVLATRAEILDGCEAFYGVPLVEVGEEGHAIVAIGHFEPRRYLAAMLAFARSRGWAPFELKLSADDLSVEAAEKAKGWLVFYRHAGAQTTETACGPDWCVCDECRWWAIQSTAADSDATAVMWRDVS
jgi:hypothetical protein